MFVKDFMSKNLITVTPETSLYKAQNLLKVNDINRLPVVVGDQLQGIITTNLINQKTASDATSLDRHELNYLVDKLTVEEVMSKDVMTIGADDLIEEAAGLMRSNDIGALVVVGEGQPIGIITDKDIFRAFVDISGYNSPGVTIVVELTQDRIGVLEEIGDALVESQVNLTHMIVYHLDPGVRVVMHVDAQEPTQFVQGLEARGYTVYQAKDKR